MRDGEREEDERVREAARQTGARASHHYCRRRKGSGERRSSVRRAGSTEPVDRGARSLDVDRGDARVLLLQDEGGRAQGSAPAARTGPATVSRARTCLLTQTESWPCSSLALTVLGSSGWAKWNERRNWANVWRSLKSIWPWPVRATGREREEGGAQAGQRLKREGRKGRAGRTLAGLLAVLGHRSRRRGLLLLLLLLVVAGLLRLLLLLLLLAALVGRAKALVRAGLALDDEPPVLVAEVDLDIALAERGHVSRHWRAVREGGGSRTGGGKSVRRRAARTRTRTRAEMATRQAGGRTDVAVAVLLDRDRRERDGHRLSVCGRAREARRGEGG